MRLRHLFDRLFTRLEHPPESPAPTPAATPSAGYDEIEVTPHALMRYAERFTDLDVTIQQEVGDALLALRCSKTVPFGLLPGRQPATLYAWTEDEQRVYAIHRHRSDQEKLAVLTVLYPGMPR